MHGFGLDPVSPTFKGTVHKMNIFFQCPKIESVFSSGFDQNNGSKTLRTGVSIIGP
jgi:hypothetical protein